MTSPVFDSIFSDVLDRTHVAQARLADARSGIGRLHGPDEHERCPTCRADWPCPTYRLVEGLASGELGHHGSELLVDEALRAELIEAGEEEPMVPSQMPSMTDLLDTTKTGKALDVLFGGSEAGAN